MENLEKARAAMNKLFQLLEDRRGAVVSYISVAEGFYAIEDQNGEITLAFCKSTDSVELHYEYPRGSFKIFKTQGGNMFETDINDSSKSTLNDWVSYFEEVHEVNDDGTKNSDYQNLRLKLSKRIRDGEEVPKEGSRLFRLKR